MEPGETLTSRRVLVVDDEADMRDTLADLLEELGYEVSTAANGREALRRLESEPAPSVILLDLMMPVMDGWTFRNEQARRPGMAEIPVWVFSASADAREAVRMNAAGYFAKPVDVSRLLNTLAACCP
jgi:CheY-like chemotaxis protein